MKVSDSLLQANSNIEVSQHLYQIYPILFADIIAKYNSVLGLPIISNLSISDYISVDIGQHHPNNYMIVCFSELPGKISHISEVSYNIRR